MEEVWCVAKVYDDATNKLLNDEQLSTSPAVVFGPESENERVTLENGRVILVEGKPRLLDHLAVCEKGVWDKGGPAVGIERVVEESTVRKDSDGGEGPAPRDMVDALDYGMLLMRVRVSNALSSIREKRRA